mgnify:CR=1 FL=1
MPLSSEITVCAGPGNQVGALGGKSPTARRSGGPRSGKAEGSGQSSWPCRFGLAVNVMGLTENQPNQIKSELKVYLADHSYD